GKLDVDGSRATRARARSFLTVDQLVRRAAITRKRESLAGDSRDSRSNRRCEARDFALVQKKFSPRFSVRAVPGVAAIGRAEARSRRAGKFCDEIVTA